MNTVASLNDSVSDCKGDMMRIPTSKAVSNKFL